MGMTRTDCTLCCCSPGKGRVWCPGTVSTSLGSFYCGKRGRANIFFRYNLTKLTFPTLLVLSGFCPRATPCHYSGEPRLLILTTRLQRTPSYTSTSKPPELRTHFKLKAGHIWHSRDGSSPTHMKLNSTSTTTLARILSSLLPYLLSSGTSVYPA